MKPALHHRVLALVLAHIVLPALQVALTMKLTLSLLTFLLVAELGSIAAAESQTTSEEQVRTVVEKLEPAGIAHQQGLKLKIVDAASSQAVPALVEVTDSKGKAHVAEDAVPTGSC